MDNNNRFETQKLSFVSKRLLLSNKDKASQSDNDDETSWSLAILAVVHGSTPYTTNGDEDGANLLAKQEHTHDHSVRQGIRAPYVISGPLRCWKISVPYTMSFVSLPRLGPERPRCHANVRPRYWNQPSSLMRLWKDYDTCGEYVVASLRPRYHR